MYELSCLCMVLKHLVCFFGNLCTKLFQPVFTLHEVCLAMLVLLRFFPSTPLARLCKSAPTLGISAKMAYMSRQQLQVCLSPCVSMSPVSHNPLGTLSMRSCPLQQMMSPAQQLSRHVAPCFGTGHMPYIASGPPSVHTCPNSTHYHYAFNPSAQGFMSHWCWVTAWSTHSQQCMCWLGALKSPCTSLLVHNNSLPESLPELMPQMQIILDAPLGSQIVKQRRMAKTGLCKLTLPVAACTVTGTLTLSC